MAEGKFIVDLGVGTGRDAFILSKLVGPAGLVLGIDMIPQQIELANKFVDYHMKAFGYDRANISFTVGYIEDLAAVGLEENSVDICVSNGVFNLTPDKEAVLAEAFKVLKEGGELYFSDIYASVELPDDVRANECLWGQCFAGALHWKELYRLAREVGFYTPRLIEVAKEVISDAKDKEAAGDVQFVTATFRLFKPRKGSKPISAGTATYDGNIKYANPLKFDFTYTFEEGVPQNIDMETREILKTSRLAEHFTLQEDKGRTGAYVFPEMDPFIEAEKDPECVTTFDCRTSSCKNAFK